MVEQDAVNIEVTGSSPVVGAKSRHPSRVFFYGSDFLYLKPVTRQIHLAIVTGSAMSSRIFFKTIHDMKLNMHLLISR
jgi:hypothetical protein